MSEINEEEVQNNSENKNIKQQPQVVPVIDHRLLAGKLTVESPYRPPLYLWRS